MNEIMKRPADYIQYGHGLKSCYFNINDGSWVKSQFYNVGYWKANNIPRELEEKNWVPDKDKLYKYYWYHTNPADPADSGEDILVYIEEYNIHIDRPNIRMKIMDKLYELNDDSLYKVLEYISKL